MKIVRLRVILVATVVGLAALAHAPAALAACAANNTNMGQVTGSFTIGTAGTFRVWSRISVPDTTNNSFTLEVDGTQCNITVGDNVSVLNTWTWVDYQLGTTTNKINMTLAAGSHTYTLYGREPNVKVDRIIFVPSTSTCVPADGGNGDECLAAPADLTAPSVPGALSNPSKTSTSITLAWGASTDNTGGSGVASYKIYRGGSLLKTIAAPTLTYTDTNLTAATNYNYQVSAVDVAGNESAKNAVMSITTNPGTPPPDLTAPSVPTGLTSTGKSATNINLAWGASTDNTGGSGVAGYKLYRNGTLFITLNGLTYNDQNLTGSTTYNYQVSAYDVAGNESAKSTPALTVTTNAPSTPKVGDFDGDNVVGFKDLGILLANYNKTNLTYDLTGDGVVNFKDLGVLLSRFGK